MLFPHINFFIFPFFYHPLNHDAQVVGKKKTALQKLQQLKNQSSCFIQLKGSATTKVKK
jgi:hypothetical protein